MKFAKLATAAVLGVSALTLAGCATDYSSVTVMAEPTPVSGTTYAWKPVVAKSAEETNPAVDNAIFRQRVETAVNAALAAKGYRLASDAASADLLVAYRVGIQQKSKTEVTSTPSSSMMYMGGPGMHGRYGYGGSWGWGVYGPPETSVRQIDYTEGGLLLDIMDAKSGKLEWRALYKDRVNAASASQASLDATAVKVLASLPAPGGVAVVK